MLAESIESGRARERERERVRKGRRSRERVRAIQKELRGENILVELMNRQTGEKSNSATN